MIRIVNNKPKLNANYNGKWRESSKAQAGMVDNVSITSSTPQSDVDVIASTMDKDLSNNHEEVTDNISKQPLLSPKEQDISNMMQNFIRQNGGVVNDDSKIKKNQTLLG